MDIRILEPHEYKLLDCIPAPDGVKLDPENTWVAAAIDDGKLVGRLAAISLPHIEAAWIDQGYRGSMIGVRMETLLEQKLKELGANLVLAFAVDETMESYLQRLGYQKIATAWKKEI